MTQEEFMEEHLRLLADPLTLELYELGGEVLRDRSCQSDPERRKQLDRERAARRFPGTLLADLL